MPRNKPPKPVAWLRSTAALGTLGTVLALLFAACGQQPQPSGTTSNAEGGSPVNPYAGGVSYPWSDRLDPAGSNPYANGRAFPWTGPKASGSLGKLATSNFLSDLTWTSATNSWGPAEKDTSNGEQNAGDGRPITIGGQVYSKGLGVHAGSELRYTLGGNCNVFTASVGVDDEVGNNGSVNFQLFDGSTLLYDSGVLRGVDSAKQVSVPITGVQTLRLVVTNGGDNIDYDHADWGNAAVSCESSAPPAGTTQLSALNWQSATNGWGPVERNQSNGEQGAGDGRPLTLGGVVYPQGLGVHAASELTFALGGTCSTFNAFVGIDAEVGNRGSVNFQVWNGAAGAAGTTLLYDSGVVSGGQGPKQVSVPVTGVQTLRLVVTNGGDSIDYDHADWADAKVTCGPPPPPSAPASLSVKNLAVLPSDTRMVFSRIRDINTQTPNVVHDTNGMRLSNAGPGVLHVTALDIQNTGTGTYTGPSAPVAWKLDPAPALPFDIAPGASFDITVRFIGAGASTDYGLPTRFDGRLNIVSSDTAHSPLPITLAGLWQTQSENYVEPSIYQISDLFGYKTVFSPPGQDISALKGQVTPQSADEVISAYWQPLVAGQQVQINQIDAYHTQGNSATLAWFNKGNPNSGYNLITQAASDGQSVLPHASGSSALAATGFTPTSDTSAGLPTFGFKVDGFESSDPAQNQQQPGINNGCSRPCGNHLRFFKLRGPDGAVVSGQYILILDYGDINYDYQDVVYLVSNVKPAPILYKVGGAQFTDNLGQVWLPDLDQNNYALFSPSDAPAEPRAPLPYPYAGLIGNTATGPGPQLYRSYRAYLNSGTTLSFNVPLNDGSYTVKLHMIDLYWSAANQRVFNVYLQNSGTPSLTNEDIIAKVGPKNALVETVPNVQVTGGKLVVKLTASIDFAALSGIEILR